MSTTVRGYFIEQLIACGMSEMQAHAVMEQVIAQPDNHSMLTRWDEEANGYPTTLLSQLWIVVKQEALIWIDENKPKAWFRPVLAI